MRNALKVAKWEIKRNLKNKSFLIGLFLTPFLIVGFGLIGGMIGGSAAEDDASVDVHVNDASGVYNVLEQTVQESNLDWNMQTTDTTKDNASSSLEDKEDTAYIFIDDEALKQGTIPVYTSEDISNTFMDQIQMLSGPIKSMQLGQLDLSEEEQAVVSTPVQFKDIDQASDEEGIAGLLNDESVMNRLVTGLFAGIILFSIVFSGMYIFQSASQEKKDKIAEIILSSVTSGQLMQGKIIGYFILGMLQSVVLLLFAIPMAIWKLDVPVFEYLLVPKTLLLVALALMGYLLFAAIFVGIGATITDASSAGQFQGIVIMLPFLPFIFVGPLITNPDGLVAQIGSFIPFTSPGVLILRLSMLEEWPWMQIIISLAILAVSIWICMKLAGKIFKTGILMYGKNATPKEIWKWLRA